MKADLYWVPGPWPGRLAISKRPRGGEWLEDEAKAWKAAGVSTVVSLLEEDESTELGLAREAEAAGAAAVEFISLPVPDRGVPGSAEKEWPGWWRGCTRPCREATPWRSIAGKGSGGPGCWLRER